MKREKNKGKERRDPERQQEICKKSKEKHLKERQGVGGKLFITAHAAYFISIWEKFHSASSSRSHQNLSYSGLRNCYMERKTTNFKSYNTKMIIM